MALISDGIDEYIFPRARNFNGTSADLATLMWYVSQIWSFLLMGVKYATDRQTPALSVGL
jgi:hypothetical protein